MTPSERFWSKVELAEGDCWEWAAYRCPDGYGRFSVSRSQRVQAHRYSYEAMVADIPPGLTIDHLCRNRACVNPYHLEPVSVRVNTLRGDTIQARNAAKTRCDHGHEFTPANTYMSLGRYRKCRACAREREQARRERRADGLS